MEWMVALENILIQIEGFLDFIRPEGFSATKSTMKTILFNKRFCYRPQNRLYIMFKMKWLNRLEQLTNVAHIL